MPLVKLHVSDDLSRESGERLLSDVLSILRDTLAIDPKHGHAILYSTGLSNRACHECRDGRFVFVEVALFSGRTDEMKAELFRKISGAVHRRTGVDESDIIIYLIEADRGNWAGRGGIPLSTVRLGY
ncbi:MAG: tautomerase family protein [Deltaproteobacteria bacterium]|nr:tautomerase family protein [Candidatus Zymogenaceae bacterium]